MTKTDDIIETLVGDLRPVPGHLLPRRFALAVVSTLTLSLLLMVTLGGLRADLPTAAVLPVFWIKFAYNALIALAALAALYRIARPDGSPGAVFRQVGVVLTAMSVISLFQFALTPADGHRGLILGHSAVRCPFLIVAYAMPILAGLVWMLRIAAPTDLGLAGLLAGLSAGAAGAWVYSWFCTENGMPFVLIWYTLGILVTGLLGRLLGPRLLRW